MIWPTGEVKLIHCSADILYNDNKNQLYIVKSKYNLRGFHPGHYPSYYCKK